MEQAATDKLEERTLGKLLSEERERQGLSRADAAQRLHMSAYQVEALETGDYTRLPKGTFLRGFVRNYAKVLGLDPEATLSHLAAAAPRSPAPGIVVPSQNIRFDPIGDRLANPYIKAASLAVVAVALIFAAMYWWLFIRPAPPPGAAKKSAEAPAQAQKSGPPQQIAVAPMQPAEVSPPTQAPLMAEPAKVEPARSEPKAEPPPVETRAEKKARERQEKAAESAPTPAALRPVAVASGERSLKFRFRGESWVEIRDAQGKVLLSRLNARGSEAEIAARPPITVVVGNAPDVQLLYNDREFPLEPHTRVAVARFTLE